MQSWRLLDPFLSGGVGEREYLATVSVLCCVVVFSRESFIRMFLGKWTLVDCSQYQRCSQAFAASCFCHTFAVRSLCKLKVIKYWKQWTLGNKATLVTRDRNDSVYVSPTAEWTYCRVCTWSSMPCPIWPPVREPLFQCPRDQVSSPIPIPPRWYGTGTQTWYNSQCVCVHSLMFHAAIVSMPKFSAYSTSKHALHGENNMPLPYY